MTQGSSREGILPDASVWITWFKVGAVSPQKDTLNDLMVRHRPIYTCPAVYQEVLQGVREEAVFITTKQRLLQCKRGLVDIDQATEKAVEIFRLLRKKGVTIRKSNDCLIAAYALLNDLRFLPSLRYRHRITFKPKYCSMGSKSRSLWSNRKSLSSAYAAIKQSLDLRMVTPFLRSRRNISTAFSVA